jgi:hypothetical protein
MQVIKNNYKLNMLEFNYLLFKPVDEDIQFIVDERTSVVISHKKTSKVSAQYLAKILELADTNITECINVMIEALGKGTRISNAYKYTILENIKEVKILSKPPKLIV